MKFSYHHGTGALKHLGGAANYLYANKRRVELTREVSKAFSSPVERPLIKQNRINNRMMWRELIFAVVFLRTGFIGTPSYVAFDGIRYEGVAA